MKKITLTTIFALLVAMGVSAQNLIGIKGGFNSAVEYGENEYGKSGSTGARIGLHFGFFLESPIGNKVDIQPELVYSMQGADGDGSTDKFDYINFPLIFKIYVNQPRSFSIDVGPQVGYLLSAKIVKGSITRDIMSEMNRLDAALCVGISYKINDNFHLGLRYNVGLTKLVDRLENRNGVAQIGIGYKF